MIFGSLGSQEKWGKGWSKKALADLNAIALTTESALRVRAVRDHQYYFDRLAVDFGKTTEAVIAQPTKGRLQRLKDGAHDDPDLIERYFPIRFRIQFAKCAACFTNRRQCQSNPYR